jgi:glycosyltransferase involved in cell wall biosynthesis
MTKINFFIPTYRPKAVYIEKTIDSVLNQTDNRWTLTIVDGSSAEDTDTSEYLKSLQSEKVMYMRNADSNSIGDNWNFAFSKAQGQYLVLLHDDDYLHTDYVKNMLAFIDGTENSALYFCDAHVVDQNNDSVFSLADRVKDFIRPKDNIIRLTGDEGLSSLLKGCYIFCPTVIYNKHHLPDRPFSESHFMVLDLLMYAETLYANKTIAGLNQKLYFYRRHNESQTAKLNQTSQRFEEEISLYNRLAKNAQSMNWKQSSVTAETKLIIKFHLIQKMVVSLLKAKLKHTSIFAKLLWSTFVSPNSKETKRESH